MLHMECMVSTEEHDVCSLPLDDKMNIRCRCAQTCMDAAGSGGQGYTLTDKTETLN